MEETSQTMMILSGVAYGWMHLTRKVVVIGSILVLDQRDKKQFFP